MPAWQGLLLYPVMVVAVPFLPILLPLYGVVWLIGKAARWFFDRRRRRWLTGQMNGTQLEAYDVLCFQGRPSKMNYALYCKTAWFSTLRAHVLARAFGRCEECGRKARWLEVHHRHYQTLCFEDAELDLDALCASCHQLRPRLLNATFRVGPRGRRKIVEPAQPPRGRFGRPAKSLPFDEPTVMRRLRLASYRRPLARNRDDSAGIEAADDYGSTIYDPGSATSSFDRSWMTHDPDDGVSF